MNILHEMKKIGA